MYFYCCGWIKFHKIFIKLYLEDMNKILNQLMELTYSLSSYFLWKNNTLEYVDRNVVNTVNRKTISALFNRENLKTCSILNSFQGITSNCLYSLFIFRLMRFEKTNEMLLNFNVLSVSRYESVEKDFHRYTTLLIDMKKDLDNAHSRIKSVPYVCL